MRTTAGSQYGNGYWWLRSPNFIYSFIARNVDFDGVISLSNVHFTNYGVVPALKIQLS
jgi:hypothetical protein